jgi:cytochrome c oxidase cbb3-type subunit 3
MSEAKTSEPRQTAVQTTGHAWDGDLQEYNNPVPRWWVWCFYVTCVFSLIYWVLYPAWPFGDSYTRGVKTVTVESNGEEVTLPWNTRSLLMSELQTSASALRQQEFMERIANADFEAITQDPEMMAFTRSVAKGLFGDNCSACHGRGGQGVAALYPNLADDDWLWGGTMEDIHQTLMVGRNGYMPAFSGVLSEEELGAVAEYVMTLSGLAESSDVSESGLEIFQGQKGGCHYCHTKEGTGLESQGAANLTDAIWAVVDVPGQETTEAKKEAIAKLIYTGVMGNRVMPSWQQRLSDTDIKLLTVYVHELGGGE